eukprot:scaffold175913_cov34-Tisochrysis_lutea.AAC.2
MHVPFMLTLMLCSCHFVAKVHSCPTPNNQSSKAQACRAILYDMKTCEVANTYYRHGIYNLPNHIAFQAPYAPPRYLRTAPSHPLSCSFRIPACFRIQGAYPSGEGNTREHPSRLTI